MGEDTVLRDVGPKSVDAAGEMVKNVGVHNQAKHLIRAIRENYPRELVAALSRPVDQGRTKLLLIDEVSAVVQDVGWKDVTEVEGARVYGKGKQAHVGIVFRTESGRSARGAIPYERFPRSSDEYDQALKSGGVVVTDEDDPRQLRRALEAAQKQLSERDEGTTEGTVEAPEPYPGYADANVEDVAAKIPDLTLTQLVALRDAEQARKDPRDGVLEPVEDRLAAAETALEEEAEEAEPFEGYAEMNGDEIAAQLPELDLQTLIAVKTAEEEGKARKGVLEPLGERLTEAEAALKGS